MSRLYDGDDDDDDDDSCVMMMVMIIVKIDCDDCGDMMVI